MNGSTEIISAPKSVPQFNINYGLWIFAFIRGGTNEPVEPDRLPFREFQFYDISHMYDGEDWYCDEKGGMVHVNKGDAIIVPPYLRHKYGGAVHNYTEDAISFCGPLADGLFKSGLLPTGVVKLGSIRRLLPIIEMAMNCTRESQFEANLMLQKLIHTLYKEQKADSNANTVPNFIDQLLNEIKQRPDRWWSIETMAELCNLSTTHFNLVFKRHTGMTPKFYIDNVKMLMAVEMLSSNNMTVKQIAAQLGFSDQYHFSRRFRQIKGVSPKIYREKFAR